MKNLLPAHLTPECSKPSKVIDNLVIDHNNWENAIEVFAERTG